MTSSIESMNPDLIERARRIRLVVLDVDGVLTDGVIALDDLGNEHKNFHVRDGSAIAGWIRSGGKMAILSGRRARCVDLRARELGIETVLQGNPQKLDGLEEILASTGIAMDESCFVGDDLPDLPLFRSVGLAACPSDSVDEIREAAHFVSRFPGGRGAVHEVVSLVMKAQNLWQSHVRWYEERSRIG
jgi:3-deoxy-D-manno-octulosonate 8-phosphate phosphatase (KDO 8-P phosphatase)